MNAGLTESQEDLLDKVARPSKRLWLRRMLVAANQSESDREIRRIEKLLAAEFGAVREDLKSAVKRGSGSGGKVWAWAKKVLSFASSEASKIHVDD